MPEMTVAEFHEHVKEPLQLELLAGVTGLSRKLRSNRIQKPGLALAGYTAFVHRDRVQILGQTELDYLGCLSPEGRETAVQKLIGCKVACIILTKGQGPPDCLSRVCDADGTPLFRTPIRSSQCIRRVLTYLDDLLSPRCSLHGVLVDVDGVGVLLSGASGIGKSECALDLVSRGHRLVADDVVEIRRRGEDLVGQASKLIQNLIEVRGLGVLNVSELYGVAATREHKRIELHIELTPWSAQQSFDRTGLEERERDILGVRLRSLRVPVYAGRNVAGIVEVAARNFMLVFRGHHAASELNQRLKDAMQLQKETVAGLRGAAGLSAVHDHIEDEVE